MYQNIDFEEFNRLMKTERDDLEIIDVREMDEFEEMKIIGSKLIPMYEVEKNLDKIDWNKKVILVCRSGSRSSFVADTLDKIGKPVMNLSGGISNLNLLGSEFLEK